MGPAKYAELQAVLELARRYLYEHLVEQPSIDCSAQIEDYLALTMRASPRELFRVMLLNVRHRLIKTTELFQGTIDRAVVYPREVVKLALKHNAAAIIVAHNHPSGEAEPSSADLDLTLRLQQALALVDIALLDHFIVGRSGVRAFGRSGSLSLAERCIL
jgi:DNA repair protein RadC